MKFGLQEANPALLMDANGAHTVFKVTRGNTTDVFAVTPEDLIALNMLMFRLMSGESLPLEQDSRFVPRAPGAPAPNGVPIDTR